MRIYEDAIGEPAGELREVLAGVRPGQALDLACGSGRHSHWLAACGWHVTAVDLQPASGPADFPRTVADLARHEFAIEPAAWDLIVCWLYWQEDLLPEIAAGVRRGGIVALAGKTTGRFATSPERYRAGFPGWTELASGESGNRVFFIARYN